MQPGEVLPFGDGTEITLREVLPSEAGVPRWRCWFESPQVARRSALLMLHGDNDEGARLAAIRVITVLGSDGVFGRAHRSRPPRDGLLQMVLVPQLLYEFVGEDHRCVVVEELTEEHSRSGSVLVAGRRPVGQMEPGHLVALIIRLAEGLAFLHDNGVVLGRIEPEGFRWEQAPQLGITVSGGETFLQNTVGISRSWLVDFSQACLIGPEAAAAEGRTPVDPSSAEGAPGRQRSTPRLDVQHLARLLALLLSGVPFDELFPGDQPPTPERVARMQPPLPELWSFLHRAGRHPATVDGGPGPATWLVAALGCYAGAYRYFDWPDEPEQAIADARVDFAEQLFRSERLSITERDDLLDDVVNELHRETGAASVAVRARIVARLGHRLDHRPDLISSTLAELAQEAATSTEVWDQLNRAGHAIAVRAGLASLLDEHREQVLADLHRRSVGQAEAVVRLLGELLEADDGAYHVLGAEPWVPIDPEGKTTPIEQPWYEQDRTTPAADFTQPIEPERTVPLPDHQGAGGDATATTAKGSGGGEVAMGGSGVRSMQTVMLSIAVIIFLLVLVVALGKAVI